MSSANVLLATLGVGVGAGFATVGWREARWGVWTGSLIGPAMMVAGVAVSAAAVVLALGPA